MKPTERRGSPSDIEWATQESFSKVVLGAGKRAGLGRECGDDLLQEVRLRFIAGRVRGWTGGGAPSPALVAAVAGKVALEMRRQRRLPSIGDGDAQVPEHHATAGDARDADDGQTESTDLQALAALWPQLKGMLTPRQVMALELRMAGVGTRAAARAMSICASTYGDLLVRAYRRIHASPPGPRRQAVIQEGHVAVASDHRARWGLALNLRAQGATYTEIGRQLNITRAAAVSLIRRARRFVTAPPP